MKIEEMDRILPRQKYPLEVSLHLRRIAGEFDEEGLTWVLAEAYCLGVIEGKRKERIRHKRI